VSADAATTRSWAEALRVYSRPSAIRMLFFGFSAGLPFLLVFTTLTAWLRDFGISKSAIGFFAWIGTMYSIKVLWAPVVDRVPLPLLTRAMGQRRSWMLLAQVGIAAGLAAMALADPGESLTAIALFAVFVAFCSATQDITIDAFRIESDADEYQAALAGTYVIGYRLAILTAGAGALYIADYSNWTVAYLCMAACMAVGMAAVLLSREPSSADRLDIESDPLVQAFRAKTATTGWRQDAGAWIVGSIIAPFKRFHSALRLAGVAAAGADRSVQGQRPVDGRDGQSAVYRPRLHLSEIASGHQGLRHRHDADGRRRRRHCGGPLRHPADDAGRRPAGRRHQSGLRLAGDGGLQHSGAVRDDRRRQLRDRLFGHVFIAFLSSLVSRRYTATQYALFSSFMTLPGKIIGGPSGVIVDSAGYVSLLLLRLGAGHPGDPADPVADGRKALDRAKAE
jgi:PAT family beta-lactamase induction signal transducer AmpG